MWYTSRMKQLAFLICAAGACLASDVTFEFAADGVDEVSSHEGEELIICLAGEVELTYGPDKTVLSPGDTAYYNAVVKHGLRALGGKPASIYGIVFMPF